MTSYDRYFDIWLPRGREPAGRFAAGAAARHSRRQDKRAKAKEIREAATAKLTSAWFDSVLEAVNASPTALVRTPAYKVAPFARYVGTSAWRKYTNRVREYARFRAAVEQA